MRFSSIGDIILTSPVVRCLKKQLNADIHFITKSSYIEILENNPYIDKIHSFHSSLNEVMRDIRKENFDWIIDLHHNLRSSKLKVLGVKHKSFRKLNIKKFILTTFGINFLPKLHIVDRYMQTVSHLGIQNDNLGIDFFIPKRDKLTLRDIDDFFQEEYISFAIGGQHKTKILPTEKIIEICKNLNKKIVLIGGKEDEKRGERIQKKIGKQIFNACGKFTINQSAYIVNQSEYIITHDTGMMHIASALNKKIISVWGNTIPDFGMYPYNPHVENKIIEVKGLSCRPCSKIGFNKCPKGHFNCMNKIDVNLFLNK